MPKLSIILPTYNEAEGITQFLELLLAALGQKADAEIIVVDDQSPDGTARVVQQFSKQYPAVRVIERRASPGLGLSILTGIEAARGDVIVGMDADNNHDVRQVLALVTGLEQADLVVASRFISGGGMQETARYYSTFAFNAVLRLLGFPTWDNGSGFYAVKRAKLKTLPLNEIYYGYGDYHLRLVYYAARAGWSILELPTQYQKRLAGESKSKLGQMAVSYFKEAVRLRFKQW